MAAPRTGSSWQPSSDRSRTAAAARLAQTLDLNGVRNLRAELHPLHPRPLPTPGTGLPGAAFLLRRTDRIGCLTWGCFWSGAYSRQPLPRPAEHMSVILVDMNQSRAVTGGYLPIQFARGGGENEDQSIDSSSCSRAPGCTVAAKQWRARSGRFDKTRRSHAFRRQGLKGDDGFQGFQGKEPKLGAITACKI